ncbi:S1 family peptidase [Actinophytocola glycyrrhizae]|uniref:S1 family peptidase n=1 Tax=Actinophytocola glycyrrhizae TaxID=2044873 RepID=A0ABV9RZA7_9PSEU
MKRTTLVRMGSTALLTLGLALTFATPANSVPVTSDLGEIQAAMQRDLGLTPQQAQARSQQEKVAWSKDKTLRIALGSDFAGSRFDAKSGKLVVDVADASRVGEVKASGALARVVEHSEAELNAVASKLAQGSASVPKSVTGWRVDAESNAVVVSVHGTDAAATSWAKGLGAEVRFEHVAERPQTFWNLIGGQAITRSGSRCSLGFNARSGSARYVITAGHCTNGGGTWSGTGGTIGGVSGSSFPTNDYGRITVSSSSAVQTGLVDRYSSGSDVRVTGSSAVGNGAAVCRSGSTTGWHCGTVSSTNATVCYSQGCVYQTFRTSVCAEPGDSGGSLVSSPSGSTVQAQGLTSGGSGNCRTGGTTYYQKINEALSAYGLSLVTG